jgi:hypothetical protein
MKQVVTLCVVKGIETMSATILNKRWNDDGSRDQTLTSFGGSQNLFCRIGVRPQERHCPSCDSIVYTRRHRLCGACGQVLPDNCRFTDDEAQNVEILVRTERQRHRVWLEKAEAC